MISPQTCARTYFSVQRVSFPGSIHDPTEKCNPFKLVSNGWSVRHNDASSVTRLGNLMDFGQFLKPLATINLPKSPTFLGNFVKVSKSLIFVVKSFLGNFNRHFAIFYWSHWMHHLGDETENGWKLVVCSTHCRWQIGKLISHQNLLNGQFFIRFQRLSPIAYSLKGFSNQPWPILPIEK